MIGENWFNRMDKTKDGVGKGSFVVLMLILRVISCASSFFSFVSGIRKNVCPDCDLSHNLEVFIRLIYIILPTFQQLTLYFTDYHFYSSSNILIYRFLLYQISIIYKRFSVFTFLIQQFFSCDISNSNFLHKFVQ